MSDPAIWYLVVQLSTATMPSYDMMRGPDPLVGPITEQQCETTRSSLQPLPGVVSARCRKAIGMQTIAVGPMGYAYPIFEGDLTVSVGSTQ